MKKLFFNILALICFTVPSFAQEGGKQIEAVKVEYFTRKLQLSPAEAERFWPVYHNYQRELQQQHKERQAQRKAGGPVDELKFETRILEIRKRYRKEFSEVLPAEKVNLLFQAEREFREQLIKELRSRRQ